jgi:diketogulonate reductase-like aldo/keto reductase
VTQSPITTLNDGAPMPQLGFGVFQVPDDEAAGAVSTAIASGYRSIDTAAVYRNESGVGQGIAESDVAREDLFITTKLGNDDQGYDDALKAFDASLSRLGLDYVDLYLIHWPLPGVDRYIDTWRAFERIASEGRAKSIGVSNFQIPHLERLAAESEVTPALNQIELHPWLTQVDLREYHREHGIATEAWSPLGKGGRLLADPVLTDIAAAHGKSAAQVVLRWHLQVGNVVIPKSVTPSRIRDNIDVFDFALTDAEMARVEGLNRDTRLGPDPDRLGA